MPTPSINLHKYALAILLLLTLCTCLQAQIPTQIKGVFPQMAIISDHKDRTEAGIGAVIPWANKLWSVGYVAHIRGSGLGLYEISPDMTSRRHPASYTGTYANRFIHNQSDQAFIGPYAIDTLGRVRVIEDLKRHRLTGTMLHLVHPNSMVYFLTMEGLLFETNVYTLKSVLECGETYELMHYLPILKYFKT